MKFSSVSLSDDSGRWGKGGLFSALSARSLQPQAQYELAGKMKGMCLCVCVCTFLFFPSLPLLSCPSRSSLLLHADLSLGDAHMVAIDDLMSRDKGRDMVGLRNCS